MAAPYRGISTDPDGPDTADDYRDGDVPLLRGKTAAWTTPQISSRGEPIRAHHYNPLGSSASF